MLNEISWGSLGRVFESSEDDWSNEFKLVRVIDVIHNYARGFFELAMILEQMHNGLGAIVRGDTDEKGWLPDIYIIVLDNTAKWCKAFGFRVTESKCRTCIDLLREMSWEHLNAENMEQLARESFELRKALTIECEDERFFRVKSDAITYYEQNQFSKDAQGKLPKMLDNMEEAGKCFALARFTACAFHLMRITEAGLKALTSHYSLQITDRNWANHIRALKDHVKTLADPKEKMQLDNIIGYIEALKIVDRNPMIHIEKDYNPEQAKFLFDGIKNLTDAICALLPSWAP